MLLSLTTLNIMKLNIMTLGILTLNIMKLTIMTLSMMELNVMTLSIKTLSIMIINIMKLSITNTQQNETLHIGTQHDEHWYNICLEQRASFLLSC